ncbi:MAG: SPFH domain-containing protein [Bifidobacteriaceae bacterium]|jgi:regulator of protease activity HflC (stomatin/prohibitin superfamily)|nr:SPFH domain-containing protein [Bifidobacteriaceae bacterium]
MTTEQTASSTGGGADLGEAARIEVAERPARTLPGWLGVLIALALVAGAIAAFTAAQGERLEICLADEGCWWEDPEANPAAIAAGVAAALAATALCTGWTVVVPGTTKVLLFFGRYAGTVRLPGFYQAMPLTLHSKLSVRVRNFETGELKVNDADGNPVNIAAIVVWRVADTAKASFAVDKYTKFVEVQAESALRHVATSHPYDGPAGAVTLRGSTEQVSRELQAEVAARVAVAGVDIIEGRISKLAYAPEIAQAMLQRQQAGAIIAARELIVEGAVTMVHQALDRLDAEGIVVLDDERRAAMVSNLLVVLSGDTRATPVINAGTLYA